MLAGSYPVAVWSDTAKTMVLGSGLIVAFVAAGLLVKWLRRKYLAGPQEVAGSGKGFGMEDLEAMLADGRITKEEFRLLRRSALGLESRRPDGDNSTSSPPPVDDDVKDEAPEGLLRP